MTRLASAAAGRLLGLAFAIACLAGLTSCGSGGVSGPPAVTDPTLITIQPAGTVAVPVVAFSGLPTTFIITGGTGSYIVSSNNQAVIPVSNFVTNGTLVVTPNPVLTDTTVTLSVRDTGAEAPVTSIITVKAGTVINNITVTTLTTAGGGCDPAVCSGSDAVVSATISQGGIPLAARGVRFDVVSGGYLFVTTDSVTGAVTLSNTVKVDTDETGKASARLRVSVDAPNQTALFQVTDLGSGAFQRSTFLIAQSTGTSAGFFTAPTQITFAGRDSNHCADSSVSGTVLIFGGTPPYTVNSTVSAFTVSRDSVSFSGGSFNVFPNGTCVPAPGAAIVVRDAAGRTATTTVENVPGTTPASPLSVSPGTVTLSSCNGQANVTAAGGTGTYVASSGSDAVVVSQSGSTFTIQRRIPSSAQSGTVTVGISDGNSTVPVTVTFSGAGANACGTIQASPSTVVLTDCTAKPVSLTGVTAGNFTATSDNASVTATLSGTQVLVQRRNPSTSFTPPATITIQATNSSDSGSITVDATGSGVGSGTGSCP